MKKIEAIIRKTKFEEVKEALNENGIERLYLQIVVRDANLDLTVDAL